MLAVALWEETADSNYLEQAHCIWYNGVCRGQRPNGGFGCDHCVEDGFVRTHEGFYEAYWCCSMRGGEGVTTAISDGLYADKNQIVFPFYSNGRYTVPQNQGMVLQVKSEYPNTGHISVRVTDAPIMPEQTEFAFFLPKWAKNVVVTVNGSTMHANSEHGFWKISVLPTAGMMIELCFAIPLFSTPVVGNQHKDSGLSTLRHGVLVLGSDSAPQSVCLADMVSDGNGCYHLGNLQFHPLDQAYMLEETELKSKAYRILYQVD